ncbi:hypothetical protein P1P91_09265 [Halomonas piscis]|uniref:Uncharacterized protein n=1 Tax=Halomonas piscis TaxID=3031727 RepID=A0ABY9YYB0_9GAMM|nr:hypothetical protein [Halomonas piscis]WNK19069.1 hypothetical protein P1P91_09265 [Halomonas piscis]
MYKTDVAQTRTTPLENKCLGEMDFTERNTYQSGWETAHRRWNRVMAKVC